MRPALTDYQMSLLPVVRSLIAGKSWLPPSYVFAHVRIESGWNPTIKASDYARTGSVGLMQVSSADVQQMVAEGYIPAEESVQTIAINSLATGIAYIGWCREFLMNRWGFHQSIAYHPVCEAYNEGVGNVVRGIRDDAYWLKWSYAQMGYSFIDER